MKAQKSKIQNAAYNVGILQGMAYRTLQYHLTAALEPFGISIPEWKVLGKLYEKEKLKVVDLALMLAVDPPLITKLVHGLVEKNFINKIKDTKDQRIVYIIPTKKGLSLIPETEVAIRKTLGYLLKGVTGEDRAAYKRVLDTIVRQGKLAILKKNYLLE